ncbi:unnamed protein product [Victoria cruziana]
MEKQSEAAPSFLNISLEERREEYVSAPRPARNPSAPAWKDKQVSASLLEGCPQLLQLWCGQQWSTRTGNEYEVLDHLNSVLPPFLLLSLSSCETP